MELRYPIVLIISLIVVVVFFIFFKKEKIKYKNGFKIANTDYVRNTPYFKKKMNKYKLMVKLVQMCCVIAVISSCILIARLSKVQANKTNQYNRDIFLCMDVSASVDELNMELVKNLKSTVNSLHGERFGISIFNTSSVTLVPLTDDYDYISNVLDEVDKSLNANSYSNYGSYSDDYFYTRNYIISGTDEGYEERGSSLIGDGLASCVYDFSNLEEERTRIIIFSTDNDLAGNPIVTLKEAAQISRSKNIKVFGIGTKEMNSKDENAFKDAVSITEGKYYRHSNSTVNNIVNDIEQTSKSLLKIESEKKQIDIPEIPFVILVFSFIALIILERKVS